MCRPNVTSRPKGGPFLKIVAGRHPCISLTYAGGDFIPNDVLIEGQQLCIVVTGPNMGGKSTLMRQTGLIVVLAQLVSPFPSLILVLPTVTAGLVGMLCPSNQL